MVELLWHVPQDPTLVGVYTLEEGLALQSSIHTLGHGGLVSPWRHKGKGTGHFSPRADPGGAFVTREMCLVGNACWINRMATFLLHLGCECAGEVLEDADGCVSDGCGGRLENAMEDGQLPHYPQPCSCILQGAKHWLVISGQLELHVLSFVSRLIERLSLKVH